MLGHRTGATHLLHAAVEIVDVRLQHTVPPGHVALEQVGDLVETHSRCLAAQNDRHAHRIVSAVAASPRAVARRGEKPDRFPVAQHVRGQGEAVGDNDAPLES